MIFNFVLSKMYIRLACTLSIVLLSSSCIDTKNNLFVDKGNLLSFKFEKKLNPQLAEDIELPILSLIHI